MLHGYKEHLATCIKMMLKAHWSELAELSKVQVDALSENEAEVDSTVKEAQQHCPKHEQCNQSIKNGFQNAYTFYLSALLYQSAKQYDDAYIDYKKALAIQPNNIYLQQM
ncbi:hypothetical protein P4S63_22420 [Pseudoalteromonas sp. B193]